MLFIYLFLPKVHAVQMVSAHALQTKLGINTQGMIAPSWHAVKIAILAVPLEFARNTIQSVLVSAQESEEGIIVIQHFVSMIALIKVLAQVERVHAAMGTQDQIAVCSKSHFFHEIK